MKKIKFFTIRIVVKIFLLTNLVILSASFCQIVIQNTLSSQVNGCQMCYLSLNRKNYLYKCKKFFACKKLFINNLKQTELNFNYLRECNQTSNDIYQSSICQSSCCNFNSASDSQQINTTVSYCKSIQNAKQISKIVQISFVVLIILFLIGSLLYCLKKMLQQHHQSFQDQNCKEKQQIKLQEFKIQEQGPYHMNQIQKCAICLQQKCNLYTNCGHYYHPKCLQEWISKKTKCPVCIKQNFNPVKIYCLKCKIGINLTILDSRKRQQNLKFINTYQQMICQFCEKQSLGEQRISFIHFQENYKIEQNIQNFENIRKQVKNNPQVNI